LANKVYNHCIFWLNKPLQKRWWSTTNVSWRPCALCLQRLQATIFMWKYLAMLVSIAQCPHVIFPSHSSLVEQNLPTMVTKTMNLYVLPHLEFATIVSCSFDLWMSKNEVTHLHWSPTIRIRLIHLGMLLWGCLKCMKLLVVPWLCDLKL
jgi:hypothetical protein